MLFPIYEMPTGDSLSLPTTIPLWALTLIPPPCGLRPRGRNQVRAFRSPFLTRRWYALCVGSCKCINRERMAPAVLLNLFDSWDTGFDLSDHSLISSSSLHFVGIDTVVVALSMIALLTLIPPPPAYGRGAESGSRVSIEVNMSMSIHTDMWRLTCYLREPTKLIAKAKKSPTIYCSKSRKSR